MQKALMAPRESTNRWGQKSFIKLDLLHGPFSSALQKHHAFSSACCSPNIHRRMRFGTHSQEVAHSAASERPSFFFFTERDSSSSSLEIVPIVSSQALLILSGSRRTQRQALHPVCSRSEYWWSVSVILLHFEFTHVKIEASVCARVSLLIWIISFFKWLNEIKRNWGNIQTLWPHLRAHTKTKAREALDISAAPLGLMFSWKTHHKQTRNIARRRNQRAVTKIATTSHN